MAESPTVESISGFYDQFSDRLLSDFALGNRRAEAAIEHAIRSAGSNACRVLDLGCGIGWSSWELRRHLRDAEIVGVDLSEALLRIARTLAARNRREPRGG